MTTLEKIKEEIEKEYKWLMCTKCSLYDIDIAFSGIKSAIDKYAEQEPCDDVIDRAEAMTEIMMFAGNVKSDEEDVYIKVSDAVQLLRELPSVQPKQKGGE